MTTIPRLRLKNLKTIYSLRPMRRPEYRQIIERVAKPAYDVILSEIGAVLDAHEGDIPAEEVRQLCLKLNGWSFQLPEVTTQYGVKTPLGIELTKLGMVYYAEVLVGVATALDQLLSQYDPIPGADERDLEEEMNELRRSVEGYLKRSFPGQEDAVRQTLHARQPLGRMGRPEEIAAAALYLAADEAAFAAGSALVIDSGWAAK
jgi:Enoyl-(Acyl carrier protein) reductase